MLYILYIYDIYNVAGPPLCVFEGSAGVRLCQGQGWVTEGGGVVGQSRMRKGRGNMTGTVPNWDGCEGWEEAVRVLSCVGCHEGDISISFWSNRLEHAWQWVSSGGSVGRLRHSVTFALIRMVKIGH